MATSGDGGGLLHRDSTNAKSGKPVVEVLRDKHPEMWVPDAGADGVMAFEPYPAVPAKNLWGGAGRGRAASTAKTSRDGSSTTKSNPSPAGGVGGVGGVVGERVAALGGVPRHQELPPRRAVQARRRAARGHTSVWDHVVCKLVLSVTGLNAKAA